MVIAIAAVAAVHIAQEVPAVAWFTPSSADAHPVIAKARNDNPSLLIAHPSWRGFDKSLTYKATTEILHQRVYVLYDYDKK